VNSKISWTQVETGSAITWKYPGCILMGDNSTGAFYSVAVTNNHQQADTGTKMIHIGRNTKSTIVSKGISAGHGQNSYRGMVKVLKGAENARLGIVIEKLITALPAKLREPLILSTLEEMSTGEVAATLGINEAAVRSRVFRARQILKEKLTQRVRR